MTPERYQRLTHVLDKRQPDLTVILENVFDPHNVSAVMRTCDAVGIQEIFILNNRIPPQKKWGLKSSSTASLWLTIHQFTDAAACFASVRKKYKKIYAAYLNENAVGLYSLDLTSPVALLFGNETLGVSDECRSYTDGDFIIPQVGIIKSLNISVACAVTLYEAFRQKNNQGHYDTCRMGETERNEVKEKWGLNDE